MLAAALAEMQDDELLAAGLCQEETVVTSNVTEVHDPDNLDPPSTRTSKLDEFLNLSSLHPHTKAALEKAALMGDEYVDKRQLPAGLRWHKEMSALNDLDHERSNKTSKFAEIDNLSALAKVRIRFGFQGDGNRFEGAILGLVFEFEEQLERPPVHFVTDNSMVHKTDTYEQFFEIGPNDAISCIRVWKYMSHVRGIQFDLLSGGKSDMFGLHGFMQLTGLTKRLPDDLTQEAHETSSEIFGIAGTFGVALEDIRVLDSISTHRPRTPMTNRKKEPSESPKLVDTKEDNKDVVMGWAMVMSIFITGALVSWMGRR